MGDVIITKGDYHKNNDFLMKLLHILYGFVKIPYDNLLTENNSSDSYRIDLHLPCSLDAG